MDSDDVQRTLGRIEGMQGQILDELKHMRVELLRHESEDEKEFDYARDQRGKLYEKFDVIQSEVKSAKAAGKTALSIVTGFSMLVGFCISLLVNWWKAH